MECIYKYDDNCSEDFKTKKCCIHCFKVKRKQENLNYYNKNRDEIIKNNKINNKILYQKNREQIIEKAKERQKRNYIHKKVKKDIIEIIN